MHSTATYDRYCDPIIQTLYLHQQPEPIDPDEETPPVKTPPEKPPVLPPDDVPERPAPVPPIEEPGHPDLPGHIISRSGAILSDKGIIGITLPRISSQRE